MSTIKVNGEEITLGRSFSHDDPVDPKDPSAISNWEAEQGGASRNHPKNRAGGGYHLLPAYLWPRR